MALRLLTSTAIRSTTRLAVPQRALATKAAEDTRQIGEYPDLPLESSQRRDPFKYWDSQDRRNFGEPLQEHDEALSMWVVDDVVANDCVSPKAQLGQLLFVLGGLGLLLWLASTKDVANTKKPVNAKEFPDVSIPSPISSSNY
eukprot:m.34461 g.34461  ORF g.34461 m.34461 type:complete len:143 (-) comp14305_c0_seq1:241-669(-)